MLHVIKRSGEATIGHIVSSYLQEFQLTEPSRQADNIKLLCQIRLLFGIKD